MGLRDPSAWTQTLVDQGDMQQRAWTMPWQGVLFRIPLARRPYNGSSGVCLTGSFCVGSRPSGPAMVRHRRSEAPGFVPRVTSAEPGVLLNHACNTHAMIGKAASKRTAVLPWSSVRVSGSQRLRNVPRLQGERAKTHHKCKQLLIIRLLEMSSKLTCFWGILTALGCCKPLRRSGADPRVSFLKGETRLPRHL